MGGKKKRRAEAAAVAAAARFQRPQAAPPANSEKSQSPRPPVAKPTAKENKVKTGPKMYSFGASGASDLGTAGTSDRTVLKVVIKSELEKKVIGLINQFKVHHSKSGTISGRLTAKKLQDIYSALQDFSFRTEDIEEAMKNTVVYGGDLHSALDWLCLNLPDDLLPDGFSQKLEEEETKSKPKFQMPVICATNHEVCDRKKNVKKPEAKVAESESSQVSMKDWILQYAEASSGSDADEIDRDVKEPENSEMEERFDPAPATKRPMTSREKMRRLRAKKRQLDPDFSSKESKRVEALRTKRLQKMTKDQMTAYRQAAAARKQKSRLNKLKTELSEAQVPFFGK